MKSVAVTADDGKMRSVDDTKVSNTLKSSGSCDRSCCWPDCQNGSVGESDFAGANLRYT